MKKVNEMMECGKENKSETVKQKTTSKQQTTNKQNVS